MCDEHCYGKKTEPTVLVFIVDTLDHNARQDMITKVFRNMNDAYKYMDKYHDGVAYKIQTRELL
jgi:hypothetical protein